MSVYALMGFNVFLVRADLEGENMCFNRNWSEKGISRFIARDKRRKEEENKNNSVVLSKEKVSKEDKQKKKGKCC